MSWGVACMWLDLWVKHTSHWHKQFFLVHFLFMVVLTRPIKSAMNEICLLLFIFKFLYTFFHVLLFFLTPCVYRLLWSVVVYLHLQTKLGSGGAGAAGPVSSHHHHQQQQQQQSGASGGTGQMTAAGTNRLTGSCDSSVAAAAAAANAAGLEALANAYTAGIQQFTTGGLIARKASPLPHQKKTHSLSFQEQCVF